MTTDTETGGSPAPEQQALPAPQPSRRQRLSPVPVNERGRIDPSRMNPYQAALRQSLVNSVDARKARRLVQRQIGHIKSSRDGAAAIKFLFDEQGRAPANAPLEDIVEERRRTEYHLLWLEGFVAEMRNRLVKIRRVEDAALEILAQAHPDE
jgi:hypothetical protein